jgi:hypothetical protein
MRITESQLRRIIRQEVGRAHLTEMAAPAAGGLAVFEFNYPDQVLPDGRTVLDTLKEEAAAKGLPAPIGPIKTSIGGYAIMVGPSSALGSIEKKLDRAFGDFVVEFKTRDIQKYLEGTKDPKVKRGLNAALKQLGWSPTPAGARMAKLYVDLVVARGRKEAQALAAEMGLEVAMGLAGVTVTGPRSAVEKFAVELESAYAGGAQSIDPEDSLLGQIQNI